MISNEEGNDFHLAIVISLLIKSMLSIQALWPACLTFVDEGDL